MIDSVGSYTYPFQPVGLTPRNSGPFPASSSLNFQRSLLTAQRLPDAESKAHSSRCPTASSNSGCDAETIGRATHNCVITKTPPAHPYNPVYEGEHRIRRP